MTTKAKFTPENAPAIDSPRISFDGGGGSGDPEDYYTDSQTGDRLSDCWITLLVDGIEVHSKEWTEVGGEGPEPTTESIYSEWIESLKESPAND